MSSPSDQKSFATANADPRTIGSMARSKRALPPQQNDVLRALARSILDERFEGNQAAMAREMGISAAALSDFLAENRGAGFALLDGLAKLSGKSESELRGTRIEYDKNPKLPPNALGHHADWKAARDEALARFGRFIDEATLEEVAEMQLSRMPERLTAEIVKGFHDALARAKGLL